MAALPPLFLRFVEDELALAPALVQRVRAGTQQLLGSDGASAGERAQYGDIVKALQRDGALYEKTFVESLKKRVEEETRAVQEDAPAATAGAKGGLESLELMDESRVEVDIELSRAMQLIDSTAEWELRELQTFTSTLVGERHVNVESNPFRPLVYASALWDAACAVVSSPTQRAVALRTSAGVAAGLLKSAWAAASTRLESQGVQPGVYRTLVFPSGATFNRFAGAGEPARSGGMTQLLTSMPVSERDATRGLADDASSAPVRSDGGPRRNPALEQALLRLDELLRHLPADTSLAGRLPGQQTATSSRLEQHRAALVATASETVDRQLIEFVTRLFEALLADSQLPAPFRPVLARMQIAALRVVLAEPSALDSFAHPVWALVDRIGETSIGYSRVEDARPVAFLQFAQAVAEEMAGAAAPDAALFRRGLNRVESFLAEQLQAHLRAARPTVEALQLAERREILQQHLAGKLTDQMVPVRTTPAIRRFVTGTWARVIAEDMLRHGEQSEPAMADLKTVDDLLWSLQIPDHPQSRQRLLQMLAGLLQRLRVGMELVALPPADRQIVLDELMAIHAEALRPGARGAGSLSPEEIVQRMRDEVVPDAPVARSFSDSVIDLSSMDTVPAEHLPSSGGETVEDEPAKRIDALRAGSRQRIFLQGRWMRVQLLWRSDRSLFFLFAGELPGHTHSITRRALERLAAAGLVQPIEAKTIVQRAVDRLMREVAARQAAPA